MTYLKVSQTCVLNLADYSFIEESFLTGRAKEQEVHVPPALWQFDDKESHCVNRWYKAVNGKTQRTTIKYVYSKAIRFRHMAIEFVDLYKRVNIKFTDPKTGLLIYIQLSISPYKGRVGVGLTSANRTLGAYCLAKINGDFLEHTYRFEAVGRGHPNFRSIIDFAEFEHNYGDNHFMLGLSQNPYDVYYKSKLLNGQSYALLCGNWAVILGDDFTFDSLCYLDGADENKLYVNKFVYSVNTYILKIMTMWK